MFKKKIIDVAFEIETNGQYLLQGKNKYHEICITKDFFIIDRIKYKYRHIKSFTIETIKRKHYVKFIAINDEYQEIELSEKNENVLSQCIDYVNHRIIEDRNEYEKELAAARANSNKFVLRDVNVDNIMKFASKNERYKYSKGDMIDNCIDKVYKYKFKQGTALFKDNGDSIEIKYKRLSVGFIKGDDIERFRRKYKENSYLKIYIGGGAYKEIDTEYDYFTDKEKTVLTIDETPYNVSIYIKEK